MTADYTDYADEICVSVPSAKSVGKTPLMKHEEITRDIIGAAMAVLNELKPGLDEKLYENALVIEFAARGHKVEAQREFPVYYRNHFVGKLVPDLIVDDAVLPTPRSPRRSTTRMSRRCSVT